MVANILKLFFILFIISILPIKVESIHASGKKNIKILYATFSPNKRFLAFEANTVTNNKPDEYRSLWYIDLKNKKLLELANNGFDQSWSPDSKKIAYLSYLSAIPYLDIKIVDIKTKKKFSIRTFLPSSSNLTHRIFTIPKWSPTDSNKLIFIVKSKAKGSQFPLIKNLYLLNIKEKIFIKLTENDLASLVGWDWSGNGKYIYYVSIKPKQYGIYRINIENKKKKRIISDINVKYFYRFYFSPCSKKIIYSVMDENANLHLNYYIFKENDNSIVKSRLLFSSTKNVAQIVWSPTNKNEVLYEVVYFKNPQNIFSKIKKVEIYKANIKTFQTKKLFDLQSDEFLIDWISPHEIVIRKDDNQLFEINLKTCKKKKLFPF